MNNRKLDGFFLLRKETKYIPFMPGQIDNQQF
jgi:hypothetical protein